MIRSKKYSGVTLIELVFVLFISSIVFGALLSIYYYGIVSFRSVSSKYQMLSEGSAILDVIGASIRTADTVRVYEASDPNRTRLSTKYSGQEPGTYEYYYNPRDSVLKMNDLRMGHNDYNVTILPIPPIGRTFGTMKKPFNVKKVYFQRTDDDGPNAWTVKVDLVLEDGRGDTLALSRTDTRFKLIQ
jgi:hypothetical protein